MKQVILISGTSRGLGKALSEKLAESHIVYGGVRDEKDFRKKSSNIKNIQLDLAEEESISKAVDTVIRNEKKIDVVIHNAGIAIAGGVDSLTMDEVHKLFQVNLFGALRLNQLILPYMRQKKKGKIIFISSIRGIESWGFFGVYSGSKAALESVAFDWAVTLDKWNIKVSIVQPGPIRTGCEIFSGTYFDNKENPYPSIPSRFLEWEDTEEVVKVIESIVHSKKPKFAYQTTKSSENVVKKHLKDPSREKWINEQRKWMNSAKL